MQYDRLKQRHIYSVKNGCLKAGCIAGCKPQWIVKSDTNAHGAEPSDSFTVPDVDTCLNECGRVPNCVAVDVNTEDIPLVCWPHFTASNLKDDNIFSQPGTNHYQLAGSCASRKSRVNISTTLKVNFYTSN